MLLDHIDHVALAVADVELSAGWYREVLGLERRHQELWGDEPAVLYAGMTAVALFAGARPPAPAARSHAIGMRHLAFRSNRENFLRAQAELRGRGIEIVFADHQISHSIYFHDPDGHQIEITTYELNGAV